MLDTRLEGSILALPGWLGDGANADRWRNDDVHYAPSKRYEIKVWDLEYRRDPIRTLMPASTNRRARAIPGASGRARGPGTTRTHGECAGG